MQYAIIDGAVTPCRAVPANDIKPVCKVQTLTEARKRCKRGQSVIRTTDRVAVCVKRAA
jgi:hypothetical protein